MYCLCKFALCSPSNPLSAKERAGFGGGGGFDNDKFSGNWRRDAPLPDLSSRDGSKRRFDGPSSREPAPAASDNISDWRSNRPPARASPSSPPSELEPQFKRRGSGFRSQDGGPQGAADTEETWAKGSKFIPSGPPEGVEPRNRYNITRVEETWAHQGIPRLSLKREIGGNLVLYPTTVHLVSFSFPTR